MSICVQAGRNHLGCWSMKCSDPMNPLNDPTMWPLVTSTEELQRFGDPAYWKSESCLKPLCVTFMDCCAVQTNKRVFKGTPEASSRPFLVLAGRLCPGGEAVPGPPLAQPGRPGQQHLRAAQPGEGERRQGRPRRGARRVRPPPARKNADAPGILRFTVGVSPLFFFQCGRSHGGNVLHPVVSDAPAGGRRLGGRLPGGQADEPHETGSLQRHCTAICGRWCHVCYASHFRR